MTDLFDWHYLGPITLILFAIVIFVPIPHWCKFSWTRIVNAPAQQLWDRVIEIPEVSRSESQNARDPLLPSLTSRCQISKCPEIWENTFGYSRQPERLRYLEKFAPHSLKYRVEELAGKGTPFGTDSFTHHIYEPVGGQTRVKSTIQIRSRSVMQSIRLFWMVYQSYGAIQAHYATGKVAKLLAGTLQTFLVCALISALAVCSFVMLFGKDVGLFLSAILVLHEFGHWLAMRLTGQPASKFLLIPFIGGLAIPSQSHKSLFHDAICTLMGLGFSALICLILLVVHSVTGAAYIDALGTFQYGPDKYWGRIGLMALLAAAGIGILNLIQLIPVLPLDGGHVLRAILQSSKSNRSRWVLMATAVSIGILLFVDGSYLFAGLCALGAWQAWHIGKHDKTIEQMASLHVGLITGGLLLTIAVYVTTMTVMITKIEPLYSFGSVNTMSSGDETQIATSESYSTEPNFNIYSSALDKLKHQTFVEGTTENGGKYEWRYWGDPGKPQDDFTLSVADVSLVGPPRVALKDRLRTITRIAQTQHTFMPATEGLELRYGTFISLRFTVDNSDWKKHCLGYHGLLDQGRFYVSGWYCSAPGNVPEKHDVACLIDKLHINTSETVVPVTRADCLPPHTAQIGTRLRGSTFK